MRARVELFAKVVSFCQNFSMPRPLILCALLARVARADEDCEGPNEVVVRQRIVGTKVKLDTMLIRSTTMLSSPTQTASDEQSAAAQFSTGDWEGGWRALFHMGLGVAVRPSGIL